MTKFIQTDGGRFDAGFKGEANDCVARAVAIITCRPYADVYKELSRFMKDNGQQGSARNGIPNKLTKKYLDALGFEWVPTMHIGSGTTVHLRGDELPSGRIIANVTRHVVAMIDGTIHDTHNPDRRGTRAVYGFWRWIA